MPSNISPATATAIELPYEEVIDFSEVPPEVGTGHRILWYTYRATKTQVILFRGWSEVPGQVVTVELYQGTPGYLALETGSESNQALPHFVMPGVTYFIRVKAHSIGFVGTFTVIAPTPRTSPVGSFLILDDAFASDLPFEPGVIVDSNGEVTAYTGHLVQSTSGAILRSGFMALREYLSDRISIYTPRMELVDTALDGMIGDSLNELVGIGRIEPDKFVVIEADSNTVWILQIDDFGAATLVSTDTVPSGEITIGVDSTSTIAYYGDGFHAVRTYNLVTNTAGADLVASESPTYIVSDVLVLSDDTIIVGYQQFSGVGGFVIHVNASGTILGTYTPGDRVMRVALPPEEPDEIVVWTSDGVRTSLFRTIDVATMTQIRAQESPVTATQGFTDLQDWFDTTAGCKDLLLILQQPVPPVIEAPPISEPCCCSCPPPGPGEPPEPGQPGPIPEPDPEVPFELFPQCAAGGITPSQPPLLDSEVYL